MYEFGFKWWIVNASAPEHVMRILASAENKYQEIRPVIILLLRKIPLFSLYYSKDGYIYRLAVNLQHMHPLM